MREGEASYGRDRRKGSRRVAPANKLSEEERPQILEVANSPEFASQPPSQIVPTLADRGEYLASESTIYRVLKAEKQQHHRGRAKKPSKRVVTSHCATEPNRLWAWDITWLPTAVKGLYFYWYMVLDVYSRKIVGHEVHVAESAELASLLMRKASLAEGLAGRDVVLHSDNGSAMKGATMLAHVGKAGRRAVVQPAAREQRQRLRRVAVPDLQIPAELPEQAIWKYGAGEEVDAAICAVVQPSAQAQRPEIRDAGAAPRWPGRERSCSHRKQVYEAAKQRRPERWSGRYTGLGIEGRGLAESGTDCSQKN